jgi:hypothetical protein
LRIAKLLRGSSPRATRIGPSFIAFALGAGAIFVHMSSEGSLSSPLTASLVAPRAAVDAQRISVISVAAFRVADHWRGIVLGKRQASPSRSTSVDHAEEREDGGAVRGDAVEWRIPKRLGERLGGANFANTEAAFYGRLPTVQSPMLDDERVSFSVAALLETRRAHEFSNCRLRARPSLSRGGSSWLFAVPAMRSGIGGRSIAPKGRFQG